MTLIFGESCEWSYHFSCRVIYQATSAECAGSINRPFNRPPAGQVLYFMKKWIWWNRNIFAFLCIYSGFLKFGWCFCVKSLQNRAAMPELSNWLARKAWPVLPTKHIFFKQNGCLLSPLSHLARTPSLGHWYIRVYLRIYDQGSRNHTTFLGLCSPVTTGIYRVSNGRSHRQLYTIGA